MIIVPDIQHQQNFAHVSVTKQKKMIPSGGWNDSCFIRILISNLYEIITPVHDRENKPLQNDFDKILVHELPEYSPQEVTSSKDKKGI